MRWITALFICTLMTFLTPAAANAALQVEGVRHSVTSSGARIVIDLNEKTVFKSFMLGDPYRLVIDMPDAKWKPAKSRLINDGVIKAWHSGTTDDGLTRVVFELKEPALISRAFILPKTDLQKDRLVVDLTPASENLFNARRAEISGDSTLKGNKTVASAPAVSSSGYSAQRNEPIRTANADKNANTPARTRTAPDRKYTVVVDAGHGGADPGAIGHGFHEKKLTLAFAQALRRKLEETGRYKVVMTRDKDVYIRLRDRVDISRKVNADLFISLHADKISRDNVRGASIYTLSERASDAETGRLAEGENNAGFVAGVDLSQESQDVADILLDLAMREKMNESNMFARMLTKSMGAAKITLLPKPHRSAGFAVLKAPDVPSVLIETGFLSNPAEAKLLATPQFQHKMAEAITEGIDAYFRKIQSLEKR